VINTGSKDISKLGMIEKFNNGKESHDVYSGECSKLKGSTGELFNPDVTPDSISIFMGDLCRSIPFDYEKDVQVHGITGHRFVAGDRAVDNGTKYPENLCYSAGSEDEFPSGVMNISACRYSSPIFMSYPHFFNADEYYLNKIEGLNPIKENHQSYFTLEPVSQF
jgi:scavenger receptor class B, member 1